MLTNEKPPLGLIPKEIRDYERLKEIAEAMVRYADVGMPIPIEWVDEAHDLVKIFDEKKNTVR